MRYTPLARDPVKNLSQLLIPAIILGFALSASVMRMTRSMMLEVLREDYIRTAWAKGVRESVVIVRHVLKNAMIPVVTVMGLQLSALIGGTVIMESIFVLPGMGRFLLDAITWRDYPVIQGINLFWPRGHRAESAHRCGLRLPRSAHPVRLRASRMLRRCCHIVRAKPLGAVGGLLIVAAGGDGASCAALAPYDPIKIKSADRLQAPSTLNPLGTDDFGRDILSRVIYGARISMLLGLGAVTISTLLAAIIGVLSGYYGGHVDTVLQAVSTR